MEFRITNRYFELDSSRRVAKIIDSPSSGTESQSLPGPGQGSRELRRPRPEVGSVPGGWTMNCIGMHTISYLETGASQGHTQR